MTEFSGQCQKTPGSHAQVVARPRAIVDHLDTVMRMRKVGVDPGRRAVVRMVASDRCPAVAGKAADA
jgi:hypothetical protein